MMNLIGRLVLAGMTVMTWRKITAVCNVLWFWQ